MPIERPAIAAEILRAVEGLDGPVLTSTVIATAARVGANPRVIETLRRLPERMWDHVEEAAAAAERGRGPRGR